MTPKPWPQIISVLAGFILVTCSLPGAPWLLLLGMTGWAWNSYLNQRDAYEWKGRHEVLRLRRVKR